MRYRALKNFGGIKKGETFDIFTYRNRIEASVTQDTKITMFFIVISVLIAFSICGIGVTKNMMHLQFTTMQAYLLTGAFTLSLFSLMFNFQVYLHRMERMHLVLGMFKNTEIVVESLQERIASKEVECVQRIV